MTRVKGGDDAGSSLVEMLVVIILTGVIGMVVTNSIVTGLHDQNRLTSHSVEMAKMRVAMERITREIRDDKLLLALSPTNVTVQQDVTSGTTRTMSYSVVGSGSTRSLTLTETDAGAPPVTTTLLTNIVNPSSPDSAAVFTVYPIVGYTSPSGSVDPSTCKVNGAATTTYEPQCAATVTVHIQESVPGTHEVIDLSSDVKPRNAS